MRVHKKLHGIGNTNRKGIGFALIAALFVLSFFIIRFAIRISTLGLTPGNIVTLAFSDGVELVKEQGRTNILILGIGGENHEGGDLTDTMLVASVDRTNTSIVLISIPRDIWSDTLKDKVNSAYYYGKTQKGAGGLALTKLITKEIIGIPVQYGIVFDFSLFEKAVNLVNGIDINVPVSFTDQEYPVAGKETDTCGGDPTYACRYKTITFSSGLQHMDAVRALEYVRSRHAENTEGSDFSRITRQQDVFIAIKQKLVNPQEWMGFIIRFAQIYALGKTITSDMNVSELMTFGKIMTRIPADRIWKVTIDPLFIQGSEANYGGRFVLIPVDSYEAVHSTVASALETHKNSVKY